MQKQRLGWNRAARDRVADIWQRTWFWTIYNHSLLLFVDKAHVSILVPLEVMSSIRAPWESPVLICCQRAGCSSMGRPVLDQPNGVRLVSGAMSMSQFLFALAKSHQIFEIRAAELLLFFRGDVWPKWAQQL